MPYKKVFAIMQVDQKKVLNYLFLNLDPMRKIFNVTALILYVGLTFAYLTMVQMITAQVELPTNTNVTLLMKHSLITLITPYQMLLMILQKW